MRIQKAYWYLLYLLPILAVCLTACGDKERQLGIDGWLYLAEEITLPGQPGSITDFRERNGYLYYRQGNAVYRVEAEALYHGGKDMLHGEEDITPVNREKDLPDGAAVFTGRGGSLCDYTLDSDGGICCVMADVAWTGEIQGGTLIRQRADGTEIYRLPLEELDTLNVSLAMDGRNRAFLLAGDCLYVADPEGGLVAALPGTKLKAEFYEGSGRLLEGEEGSIYYSPGDYFNIVYELTGEDAAFRGESFRMKRIELPSGSGICCSSSRGLLCSGSGLLYRYRKNDSCWEPLLRYGDSNLPSEPEKILRLSDNRIAVSYSYPYDTLYAMEKIEASSLPEKEVLVLAAGNFSSELEAYIIDFNRTNSRYHVTVEFWDSDETDVRMAASNPPDLIEMDDEMVLKYAGKGALEDLSPWLEGSKVLERDDFLENVLEGYTTGGRLVCIPDSFTCQTVLGRLSQVGEKAGWSAREAMDFAERYPEAQLFRNPTFTSMVSFFGEYILEKYIDWETGACSFDGAEFQEIVQWMEGHCEGVGNGMAGSTYDSFVGVDTPVTEDELLVLEAYIYDLSSLVRYGLWIGEDINAVGLPTADGHVCHTAYANNVLGITAASGNREAAWDFLEGFLTREAGDGTVPGNSAEMIAEHFRSKLPTRRDLLSEITTYLTTSEYEKDEEGEVIVWESTGEPALTVKEWIYVLGESIPLYSLTSEQADEVLRMIEAIDFTPRGGLRSEILGILLEELTPWLKGEKNLEEAVHILQNRVENLVRERL